MTLANKPSPLSFKPRREREAVIHFLPTLFKETNRPKGYVLLIDDCQPILDIMTRMLESAGYRVATATSGQEGLEKAWFTRPDLIFLEAGLSDYNVQQLYMTLRQMRETAHIPITLMSVDDRLSANWFVRTADHVDFLAKPMTYDKLLYQVEKWIDPTQSVQNRN